LPQPAALLRRGRCAGAAPRRALRLHRNPPRRLLL